MSSSHIAGIRRVSEGRKPAENETSNPSLTRRVTRGLCCGKAERRPSHRNTRAQEPVLLMFPEPPKSVIAEKLAQLRKQSRGVYHYS